MSEWSERSCAEVVLAALIRERDELNLAIEVLNRRIEEPSPIGSQPKCDGCDKPMKPEWHTIGVSTADGRFVEINLHECLPSPAPSGRGSE